MGQTNTNKQRDPELAFARRVRQGRCKPCEIRWIWDFDMKVRDAVCPDCDRPLTRTVYSVKIEPKIFPGPQRDPVRLTNDLEITRKRWKTDGNAETERILDEVFEGDAQDKPKADIVRTVVRDFRIVRDLLQWLRTGPIDRRVDYVIERSLDVADFNNNADLLDMVEVDINSREWALVDKAATDAGISTDKMNGIIGEELLPAVYEDQIESDDERMDRFVVWFMAEMDRLDIEHSLLKGGSPEDRQRYCDKWSLVAKDTTEAIVAQAIARSFEERRWFKMEFAAEGNSMTAEDFNVGFGGELADPNRFHVRRLAREMGPGVAVHAVYAKTHEILGCPKCSWVDDAAFLFRAPCCGFPGGRIEVDREDGHCLMIAMKKTTAQDDDDRLDPDATFVLESNKYTGQFWGPNTLDDLHGASRYSGKELETNHMIAFWMGRYTPRRISPEGSNK